MSKADELKLNARELQLKMLFDEQEKRIAELEQKLEQTEKDLADYQFNYPTIKELTQTNNNLLDVINNQDVKIADLEQDLKHKKIAIQTRNKRIADLEKKVKELEKELAKMTSIAEHQQDCNMKRYFKLEQAKELLKEFIAWFTDQTESNNWKLVVEQAEQFIGETQ